MIGAARRFSELMTDLLLRREIFGGPLPQDAESDTASELERCWLEMTNEEQNEAKIIFSTERCPDAPTQLDLIDTVVEIGECIPPRKKVG
jgi:hypothetical protein